VTPEPKENKGDRLAVVEQALREAVASNSVLAEHMTRLRHVAEAARRALPNVLAGRDGDLRAALDALESNNTKLGEDGR